MVDYLNINEYGLVNGLEYKLICYLSYSFNTGYKLQLHKDVTFSVTGKRSRTAHTGFGTILRSSGSNP